MKSLLVGSLVAAVGFTQSCSLADEQKVDCGYMGINQSQCEAKGCCWRPVFSEEKLSGTPWCFFPSGQNPC